MAVADKELVPEITGKTKNQKKSDNSVNNQTYKYINKIKNPKSNNNKAIFTTYVDYHWESDFWIYKLDKHQEFLEQCKANSALYSTKFKRYTTATNDCLFALNPKTFACIINKDLIKGEMAYNVLGTILGII
ncbi:uncharacterized protein HMPREF1541_09651 [Cyphellophora europaea CBS 101466]|uniref:Uncharacterized protein n=1 Tax=Cyphellophora europaea (strain CBS 101466) TaxID=1220924 RepID=W2SCR1_CYPE1|nr:uncharacterized protein HMPREF1541_09651 [Cyphellophora europaea CBS 101466]ETN45818.1 hypothetical protein HMPREF1541_09651 [Cyphellophora europaea CBS 101466]